jgi:hypothetical protein
MAKEQTANGDPERALYVKPCILTLKVELSFASAATNFEDILDLLDSPQLPTPNKEPPAKAKATGVGGQTLTPHP